MNSKKHLIWVVIVFMAALTWGCGSSRDAGDSIAGDGDTLASAAAVGIDNCLTCHNAATNVGANWLTSRHGNALDASEKETLNYQTINGTGRPDHSDDLDDGLPGLPNYDHGSNCFTCHDQLGDGKLVDNAVANQDERPIISCESCHGGGQFHNGIATGVAIPSPSPEQCGQCHGLTEELFHSGSSSGNNVRRNITDTHFDDPATAYNLPPNLIEGYVVKGDAADGCNACHVAHRYDLRINNDWANSPHGGGLKGQKDIALEAGLLASDTSEELLARVKAAGADASSGDGWLHYDWDDSAGNGPGGRNRSSCQRCHTSTGLVNFMADTANYDASTNDFSHLDGWAENKWSGQNELLYCWACHSNTQTGAVRDDPDGLTLDFVYEDPSQSVGAPELVVLPDNGNSNICAACHSGRGNDTSIRASYAEAEAEAAADGPGGELGGLSSRFAGHHAPTAGSLYAAVTRTGFLFDLQDYSTPTLEHDDIGAAFGGPCVACHMGAGTPYSDHGFTAVAEDIAGDITSINNQTLCDNCHGVNGVTATDLNTLRGQFDSARQYLLDLVDNVETNHLGLDISASVNRNAETLSLNDFGAFQNSLYMTEEECIYLHNSLYAKRLIFDSVDWLDNETLDGTITIPGGYSGAQAWYGGGNPSRP